jgi:hypothetical protein
MSKNQNLKIVFFQKNVKMEDETMMQRKPEKKK